MICSAEAVEKMISVMPAMEQEIHRAANKSIFELIQVFTDRIKKMVAENTTEHALQLLDELYRNGDQQLKLAIENVFIFSLETIAALSQDIEFWPHLPPNLHHAYVHQICRSNI